LDKPTVQLFLKGLITVILTANNYTAPNT